MYIYVHIYVSKLPSYMAALHYCPKDCCKLSYTVFCSSAERVEMTARTEAAEATAGWMKVW